MFEITKDDKLNYNNLVNGKWTAGNSGKYIDINSPIDNSIVGRVPAMSKEEVDYAINSSKAAQKEWRKLSMDERGKILNKAAELLEKNAEEMAYIMIREIAKDKKSALAEISRTADFIRFTVSSARSMVGESISGDAFPGYKKDKISIIKREPLGVVLAISPFNYPINLAASKIAPALIIGNSVVFKPATQGSICGIHLTRIFEAAGVPKGVINTITGRGSEIGDYVTTHRNIDFINFTGSTKVGYRIAELTKGVPLLMELGGKDAAIVLEDADLDITASNIIAGAFSYSGQRCTAIKRILVVESVADILAEKLKEKMKLLKVVNPLEENGDIVPLINKNSAEFVYGLIQDAEERGAELLYGGRKEGNIIYPTLFDKVTNDMKIAWEEPFGPVLPIIRVKDKDEAIKIANESEYGLQSAVFTQDIDKAFEVAEKLEVGTVQINNKTERGPDHFPFLGVKASGIGAQGIRYSIEAMSRIKGIVVNVK